MSYQIKENYCFISNNESLYIFHNAEFELRIHGCLVQIAFKTKSYTSGTQGEKVFQHINKTILFISSAALTMHLSSKIYIAIKGLKEYSAKS